MLFDRHVIAAARVDAARRTIDDALDPPLESALPEIGLLGAMKDNPVIVEIDVALHHHACENGRAGNQDCTNPSHCFELRFAVSLI